MKALRPDDPAWPVESFAVSRAAAEASPEWYACAQRLAERAGLPLVVIETEEG